MGADWHVWLVKKVDDIWVPVSSNVDEDGHPSTLTCFTGRNYYLFGEVGGVRGSAGKTAYRGWPHNIHKSLESARYFYNYHSLTRLTIKEMERAFKKIKNPLPLVEISLFDDDSYGNDYRAVKRYIELEEGEAMLLGIPKPKFLLLVGFDS